MVSRVAIDRVFEMENIAEAHRIMENGAGKLVVRVRHAIAA